ncbi:MAG TPA: alpha-2-macroglobulin family protein, partial [Oligoflexia bacterium]|nr:alpha-2-macroglobulin family protein [Oligoflexia bacterium]
FRIALEVLDAEKRPVANAELGVSIVDRAVYAVQPEFRPEIVEFFYPLPRMNTATFYSDELQGYGYADLLRKPNFGLGALKTSSKLAKKSMRDTAGWFPHVVTDAQGKAVIDVDMPGNITQWLVSAVCVDPHGRLGEGRGSFRSSADVIFDGVLPQFLLNGDRVEGALRLSNQTGSEAPIRIRAESGRGFSLSGAGEEHEVKLAPKSENLLPLELTADMASRAGSVRVYSAGSAQLKLGGVQEFEVPLLEAAMRQTVGGKSEDDGLVQLGIPAAAQVEALRVQVSSGLLGVALGAARRLVSYPYGCTEQLVHTTIPNMMLLDLVERAGLKSEELGGLAEASAKARRHAEHGMAKLVKNQKADGGFSLWAGESLSSFPVTVMAASALAVASELKIEGAEQARLRAERWLVNNCENYDYAGGEGLSGYELAVLAELKFWDQPVARQIAFVEKQAADAKPRADSLIYALRIIKAYETRPWHRFNDSITPEIKDSLTLKLREALTDISFNDFSRSRAGDFAVLGFSFGPVELASGALGILAALNALPDDLGARLKRFIIEAMENGGWLSTFDTAQLIFNTRELIAEEARRASEFDRERVISV